MKYMVRISIVHVIGHIWMPNVQAAMLFKLTKHDVENILRASGEISRESVQSWLDTHAGDFSSVDDFFASIEDGEDTVEIPWADEESELSYNDWTYREME